MIHGNQLTAFPLMRKHIACLLSIILLFNIGGYYLIFRIKQIIIQKEIKQEIIKGIKEKDLLVIVSLSGKEDKFVWIKPGKELKYRGEMYDVVKSKTERYNKYYFCIRDSKERQLVAHFNKTQNTKKETEKRLKRTIPFNLFFQQFLRINKIYNTDFRYPFCNYQFLSNIISIVTPPPRQN